MAAKPKSPFRGAAGPDRPQIHADGWKDGDVKNGKDVLWQLFGLFKLEGNTAKPEIEDTGATTTLVANDRVGVGSDHGNAFGFALNREGRLGLRCGNLVGQRPRCNRRSSREIRRDFFGSAARRDGDGRLSRGLRHRWGSRQARWIDGRSRVIGVLETIEPLVSDANQLIRLVAILGKGGDAVVHGHGESQLKGAESLRKHGFNTTAKGERLCRIGLR